MIVRLQVVTTADLNDLEEELRAWRDRFPSLRYCENSGDLYFHEEWGRDDMGRCTHRGERERS